MKSYEEFRKNLLTESNDVPVSKEDAKVWNNFNNAVRDLDHTLHNPRHTLHFMILSDIEYTMQNLQKTLDSQTSNWRGEMQDRRKSVGLSS